MLFCFQHFRKKKESVTDEVLCFLCEKKIGSFYVMTIKFQRITEAAITFVRKNCIEILLRLSQLLF